MPGWNAQAIRKIRHKLGVSQEDLARAIGVSFATVNRWENGKARPSRAAQRLLDEFARKMRLDLPPGDEPAQGLPPRQVRVLIVDDDEMVVQALRRTLLRHSELFAVETAADGYEAGVKTGTFRPDVVVLDIYLPGMNGFEVCRYLKSAPETAGIKVIAITGYGTESTLQEIREAGADAVLTKPLETADFLGVLRTVLGDRLEPVSA
ncbi:MAG: response regulator [candidate division KSB1 bacterium]|nr:response regulator [candidate division KSB1 bacterium]